MTLMRNKVVWITGGGTGIGKELALILSNNNYEVIVSGRRKEKLLETAKLNKNIYAYPLDVQNYNQCLKTSNLI